MYSVDQRNVSTITAEKEWNDSNEKEALMHTIHTYPAKFPAFIAQKLLNMLKTKVWMLSQWQMFSVVVEQWH